jgi:hypothetical protein
MNKKLLKTAGVLFALSGTLFCFSCASAGRAADNGIAAQSVKTEAVTTTVSSVDKYGNCTLAVTEAEFTGKGYEAGDIAKVEAGTFAYESPVCTNYSDVDNGKYLIRLSKGTVSLAINMGNFAKTSSAAAGTPVTVTLKSKAGYLQEYQIRQLKKSDDRSAYSSDEVFANFRAVKAGKIAQNRLYRSCNPVLGDVRAPYAAKLAEAAKIQTVLNLADSRESAASHLTDVPYYASLTDAGNVVFLNMGVDFTDKDFVAKLHDGLVFLAEHKNGPYLVHCNEGKDRAGFVCAVLEAASGATLEEMSADYMISFENYFGVKKASPQYEAIGRTIPDMFKVMNHDKAVTDKTVGKVAEKYLRETVGLTDKQLTDIRENLR